MNLIENTEKLYAQALTTMRKKNSDYAGKGHKTGLKNFELSSVIAKVKMSKGILVRIGDKLARIGNLLDNEAEVADETIEDTIQDAINYLAILLYAIQQEKQEKQKEPEPEEVWGIAH